MAYDIYYEDNACYEQDAMHNDWAATQQEIADLDAMNATDVVVPNDDSDLPF